MKLKINNSILYGSQMRFRLCTFCLAVHANNTLTKNNVAHCKSQTNSSFNNSA